MGLPLVATPDAQWRYAHSDHGREKMAEWERTEKGRANRARARAAYKARNPERVRLMRRIGARVARAVRRGLIVKAPCHCGSTRVEAHHPNGYEPPHDLEVEWLCSLHHKAAHGRQARPAIGTRVAGTPLRA